MTVVIGPTIVSTAEVSQDAAHAEARFESYLTKLTIRALLYEHVHTQYTQEHESRMLLMHHMCIYPLSVTCRPTFLPVLFSFLLLCVA